MGALPNVYPSYQAVNNQDFREKFEKAWGTDLSPEPGLSLMDMTHSGKDGPMKAMFIMGENPALSDPVLEKVNETLANLEFLAVADIFLTDTAKLAHVVLPAASFAEKTGTFTNSERRVQMVRQAIPPIGDCRPDSGIIMELSSRLGYPMDYDSPAEVMEEIAMLAPIYGGMHHARLENCWGLQWPCWDRSHPGTPFRHKCYLTRGHGHFVPASHQSPSEPVDEEYPLLLMTGRIYHQYHTGTMTRRSGTLNREAAEALLQISSSDAEAYNIRNGEMVVMTSRRGTIRLKAEICTQVQPGMVYTTFHYPEAPINLLCIGSRDPKANCPEFKICAVKINPA